VDGILKTIEAPDAPPPNPYEAGTWGRRRRTRSWLATVGRGGGHERFHRRADRRRAGGARLDELSIRFDEGMDLGKIRALLQQAKERGGSAGETISAFQPGGDLLQRGCLRARQAALEAAGRLHPSRQVVLIAEPRAEATRSPLAFPWSGGGGAVSLERIVLTAQGGGVRHLQSALLGLLVPDLPVVVVWEAPEGALLRRAVEAADRVIIDSGTRPSEALADVAAMVARGAHRRSRLGPHLPLDVARRRGAGRPNLREHRGNLRSARVICAAASGPKACCSPGGSPRAFGRRAWSSSPGRSRRAIRRCPARGTAPRSPGAPRRRRWEEGRSPHSSSVRRP